MTKPEAIEAAKKALAETGETQEVIRRGDVYRVRPSGQIWPPATGYRVAEYIGTGNVENY